MIEVKGLYKSFEGKTVLHNIDATFENGKTSLIIGQSGSGKTVLMKCIVGLLTPEKGEVLYDGRNFLAMGKKEKKHLRREMGNLSLASVRLTRSRQNIARLVCSRRVSVPNMLSGNITLSKTDMESNNAAL